MLSTRKGKQLSIFIWNKLDNGQPSDPQEIFEWIKEFQNLQEITKITITNCFCKEDSEKLKKWINS